MLVAGFETLPSFGEDEVRLSIFRSLGEKFVKVDLPVGGRENSEAGKRS